MKLLIALNHPAHFHLFKNFARIMIKRSNSVLFVIKEKDVLEGLIKDAGFEYYKYKKPSISKNSRFKIILANMIDLFAQDIQLLHLCLKYKPDILMGTDFAITHVGRLINKPSYVFNEDDYEINKTFCNFSYPFATYIVAPYVCDLGKYDHKRIGYEGYQKLAYMHPNWFKPAKEKLAKYLDTEMDIFLIRLVSFVAIHDIAANHSGIDETTLTSIIQMLETKGQVIIISEKELPERYKKYISIVPKSLFHDLLAVAKLVISESQTVTAEACLLGTPVIRYNSFVGKINYLNELENIYHLGIGIEYGRNDLLLEKIEEILMENDIKQKYAARLQSLLNDKTDVTKFMIELFTKKESANA